MQGIGFNVTNAAPTTSINHVIEALNHRRNANGQGSLKAYTQETLLAHILAAFEELYLRFCNNGWDKHLEDLYHNSWLHRYVARFLIYRLTTKCVIFGFGRCFDCRLRPPTWAPDFSCIYPPISAPPLKNVFWSFLVTSSSKFGASSNQIVTLEAIEGAPRARIHGITSDWAYLRAEEIDDQDHGTGKMHDLQPDGNSFDFWKGLVKRKE